MKRFFRSVPYALLILLMGIMTLCALFGNMPIHKGHAGLFWMRYAEAAYNPAWVATVPTIADIRNGDYGNYPYVNVLGFNMPNDGGGGLLNLVDADVTSADNGCTIYRDNTGGGSGTGTHRFYRSLDGAYLTFQSCGATGASAILPSSVNNVTVTLGAPMAFTISDGSFTTADVGKGITIAGAGSAGTPLITTIATVTSATTITTAASASTALTAQAERVSYGPDDTMGVTRFFDQTAELGISGRQTKGIYRISSQIALSLVSPYPGANMLSDGTHSVIIDASPLGNSGIPFVVGGNAGGFDLLDWQGITIDGGTAVSNVGLEANTQYMRFDDWYFSNVNKGIVWSNQGSGNFTEGAICLRCGFDFTVNTWEEYTPGTGANSYRGTGLVDAFGNMSSANGPLVLIDAGALPYLAPLSLTTWTFDATGANVIVQNNSTQDTPFFTGDITLEGTGSAPQTTIGAGNTYYRSGITKVFGAPTVVKGTDICTTDFAVQGFGGTVTYQPCNYEGTITGNPSGSVTVPMPFPTSFGQFDLAILIDTGAGFAYQATVPVLKQATGSTLSVVTSPALSFTSGGTTPTISTSGLNVTFTSVSIPANTTLIQYNWIPKYAEFSQ